MEVGTGGDTDHFQLLNFFRMSFLLFSLAAFLATVVLMPLNLFVRPISARWWKPGLRAMGDYTVGSYGAHSTAPRLDGRSS